MAKFNVNIVGSVKANNPPQGATLAKLSPDKSFIEKFYRVIEVKFNDGTTGDALQYFSEAGSIWVGTNERDVIKFVTEKEFYTI